MKVIPLEMPQAKILVVDDKPENLHLLADALGNQGYEVKGVVNGKMALMVANTVIPDLILLDVVMPDLNGYQVCEQLKANQVTQNIPIIFLSASNNSLDRVKALSAGGVDYINKPFQLDEVLLRIRNQLQLQAAQKKILKFNTELEQRIQERTAQLETANQELIYEVKERNELTKLLRESEEKLESILNSLEEVVWSADVETNQLLFLNPAAQEVYGRSVAELLENPRLRLESVHPEDRDRVIAALSGSQEQSNDLEYRIIQPGGEVRWVWERSRLIYTNAGIADRRDGIISDITERKKIEAELSYEAKHDSLTNLPNRAAFIERTEQALEQSYRDPDYLFAVLFIDLDRFKIVNDSLGHQIGDELLITVAQILTDCSRSEDFVARLGGDEFTILLHQLETIDVANAIAENINQQLAEPFSLQGHNVFTSASIGIVKADHKYQDIADILRDADLAMYRAKSLGKARHEVFDSKMYVGTKELLETENDLRTAIIENQLVLHYQPIISLKTDQLYGFEALLRWQHPLKGLVYPEKFIQIAEETGLIIAIGQWVLQEACQQMYLWQSKYPHTVDLKMSVNIASQQMKDPNFLTNLDHILAKTGFGGHSLHLEITETTLMDYQPETINLFKQIRDRGIRLNIDDFGTGYSSLQYLKRFPINMLKIDRSFVQGMLDDRENFEIVKMIITLSRTLKISIVAEGIENLKQLKVLQTLNCELGQGYLFSQALDQESAEMLIER
ncbi:MAG: EAL domain-containing protein [Cyanobacteria bacterium P01_A01_bin.40]